MNEALRCIQVTLPPDEIAWDELVESMLLEVGAPGFERQDDECFNELTEDPRPRAPGSVRFRVYVPVSSELTETQVRSALTEVSSAEITSWVIDDLSFLTAWKEHFRPTHVSERVWIHPPWETPESGDAVRVEIEPGMAFGTGTHETTRLCLRLVDRLLLGGPKSVLDVGTGSGILAIAARKLGASRVVGVDHDPDAVRIAVENAAINQTPELELSTTPISEVTGSYDIVVANILPHILETMVDALWSRVAPEGVLILSGILLTESERMERAFAREGWSASQSADGQWCALTWTRSES